MNGYRLHWENSAEPATAYHTMAQVRDEIRKAARVAGVSVKQAKGMAHVVTEAAYQAERAEERFQRGME